ncbi:protein-cysteine N-palmitoyltransferase Rasp isoform X2 [Diabrotica virgifera virgifera]|nr:protein-cysteine N-palmitoyltransferase Rasp isoform X2 [Diabrotica virgifera virgifera]
MEWESIMFLVTQYFPWVLIYLVVSQILKYCSASKTVLQIWQITFTVSYILLKWNHIYLTVFIIQPMLFSVVNQLKLGVIPIWFISGTVLAVLNYFKSIINEPEVYKEFNLEDFEIYLLISCLFWLNLKCLSLCLEAGHSSKTFLDVFAYCLYPPTVLTGPFILYKNFQENYNSSVLNLTKCKKFFRNIFRTMLWYICSYICLHFIYVSAAAYHRQLFENFNGWCLYGFGYTMGQFFHLKYVILYGMSTNYATFENIDVPNLPRCIGRIHLYSDMWKYFDAGLYKFLLSHIYIPLALITQNKTIRSFICFLFVYIWHGLEVNILIWTILNFFGIIFEKMYWPKGEKTFYKSSTCNRWKRRTDCLIAAFLLAISAISNFYFFAGMDVGNEFFKRLFSASVPIEIADHAWTSTSGQSWPFVGNADTTCNVPGFMAVSRVTVLFVAVTNSFRVIRYVFRRRLIMEMFMTRDRSRCILEDSKRDLWFCLLGVETSKRREKNRFEDFTAVLFCSLGSALRRTVKIKDDWNVFFFGVCVSERRVIFFLLRINSLRKGVRSELLVICGKKYEFA